MGGDEGHELLVGLGVVDLLVVALHHHGPDRLAVGSQRHPEPVDGRDADELDRPLQHHLLDLVERREQRFARPQHVGRQPTRLPGAHRLPEVGVGERVAGLVDAVGPVERLVLLVVQDDVEVVRVHQLAHDAMDVRVELLHVVRAARGLGDAVQRRLEQIGSRVGHASPPSVVHSLIRACLPRISNSSTKRRPSVGPVMFVLV